MRQYGHALVPISTVGLPGSPKLPFTVHDKAHSVDQTQVNFVRPGLVRKVVSAQIASGGSIQARFTTTGPQGLGLTAPCLGCRTSQDAAAHAARNIHPVPGEACAAYRGQDANFSVDREHAR